MSARSAATRCSFLPKPLLFRHFAVDPTRRRGRGSVFLRVSCDCDASSMRLPGLLAVVGVLSSQLAPLASHSHGVEGALEHLQRLAEKLDRDVAKAAHHLHGEAAVLSTDSDGKTRASGLFSLRLGDKADGAVLEAVGPSVVQSEASVELTVRLDHCGPQRLWTQMYLLEDVGTGDGAPRGPLFREEYPAKSLKHLLQVKGAGGGMRGTFGPNPVDKLMFLQHEVPDLSPLSVPNSVDIVQELQRTRDAHGLTVPGDGSASGMHSRRVLTSASPHAKTLRRAMLAEYDTALKEAAASSDRTGWDPAPGTQGVAKPTLLERFVTCCCKIAAFALLLKPTYHLTCVLRAKSCGSCHC